MGVADADYKFMYFDVGRNGRFSDGGVFNRSTFGQALDRNILRLPAPKPLLGRETPTPYVLLADDAFAIRPNIMKPYAQRGLTLPQRVFNYRLSRGRRIIENVFGILSARFRVLRKPIHLDAEKTKKIVLACCVLHNFLMTTNRALYAPPNSFDHYDNMGNLTSPAEWRAQEPSGTMLPLEPVRSRTDDPKEIQREFMHYFTEEGEVPWQYQRC